MSAPWDGVTPRPDGPPGPTPSPRPHAFEGRGTSRCTRCGVTADDHWTAPVPLHEDAEGALREAMTDVLAVAEVPDEDAPTALLAALADLGWSLVRDEASADDDGHEHNGLCFLDGCPRTSVPILDPPKPSALAGYLSSRAWGNRHTRMGGPTAYWRQEADALLAWIAEQPRSRTTSRGTTVRLARTTHGRVVVLEAPNAPEDMRITEAGRVIDGAYQPAPFAAFGLTPEALRIIADVIEEDA